MSCVLVMGASRGIGLEFVRQYLADGARVIATARDDTALERLRELGATALRLDVTSAASVAGLAWQLEGEKIDVALYVAGVLYPTDAKSPPTDVEFDSVMHTNVLGAMQAIPQVAPLVEAARGRFVFLSSRMASCGLVQASNSWTYRVSKAALNMAVAAARHDYPGAIMVAMSPGWVRTDMGGERAPLTAQASVASMRQAIAALTPERSGAFLDHDGTPFATW